MDGRNRDLREVETGAMKLEAWERTQSPGGLSVVIIPGKQYCEQGQHHVDRPGYVTHKGWVCDECKSKGNDDGR